MSGRVDPETNHIRRGIRGPKYGKLIGKEGRIGYSKGQYSRQSIGSY